MWMGAMLMDGGRGRQGFHKRREGTRKMERKGDWGGQGGRWGEEEEKYREGKQQIEMGKVSNGMKRQKSCGLGAQAAE